MKSERKEKQRDLLEGKLILVCDDTPENVEVIGNILVEWGVEVAVAENGQEALDLLDSLEPDLILMDVMMPGLDGFETVQRIKGMPGRALIPIIFLSARMQSEDIVQGFHVGAIDYVTKPFHAEELIVRIKTHIQLRELQKESSEYMHAREKFFNLLAHDLRAPVASAVMHGQALEEELQEETPGSENRGENLSMIHALNAQLTSIQNLLAGLLDWAGVQAGRFKPSFQEIDLQELVHEVIDLLYVVAEDKNISIETRIESGLHLHADRNAMLTVLRNLVSNAIKFSYNGSSVEIRARNAGRDARIEVEDWGMGIKPEAMAELFSVSRSGVENGTGNEKGTGLGLVVSREFIAKMNGSITVQSERNRGTIFIIDLPLLQ